MKRVIFYIYDYIGEGGITSKDLANQVAGFEEQGYKKFELHINSKGGDVYEGNAIYNLFAGRDTIVYVDSMAGSIASVIAMAGKHIYILDNALMQIHNPWMLAIGDSIEFQRNADMLEIVKGTIIKAYLARTGKTEDELKAIMDKDTLMNAETAVELGFADERIKRPVEKNFVALFAACVDDEEIPIKKTEFKMLDKLKAFFNLSKGATEEDVKNKLSEIKNQFKLPEDATLDQIIKAAAEGKSANEIAALQTEVKNLKQKIENNAEAQATADAAKRGQDINDLVTDAIGKFKINAADKERWTTLLSSDFEKYSAELKDIKDNAVKQNLDTKNQIVDLEDPKAVANAANAYKRKMKAEGVPVTYTEAVNIIEKGTS